MWPRDKRGPTRKSASPRERSQRSAARRPRRRGWVRSNRTSRRSPENGIASSLRRKLNEQPSYRGGNGKWPQRSFHASTISRRVNDRNGSKAAERGSSAYGHSKPKPTSRRRLSARLARVLFLSVFIHLFPLCRKRGGRFIRFQSPRTQRRCSIANVEFGWKAAMSLAAINGSMLERARRGR